MTVRILHGDALEQLRTLADESVQCVVTSPPYFGLRDYGTAEWDGGSEECEHIESYGPPLNKSTLTSAGIGATPEGAASKAHVKQFREQCGNCGATRIDQQIGLESTPTEYIDKMVAVFREVRRVLRKDGVCWLNIGDSYFSATATQGRNEDKAVGNVNMGGSLSRPNKDAHKVSTMGASTYLRTADGLKSKDLMGMPWRLAFALQADGWYLRQDIIWAKPNPMPESVTDRCTKAHEYIFLLSKSERYFYDAAAISEAAAYGGEQLGIVRGIKVRADAMGRKPSGNEVPGVELNAEYVALANRRLNSTTLGLPLEIAA